MLSVSLVYKPARFTSTPPQRLTSPSETQGAFCVYGTRDVVWLHLGVIEVAKAAN
jgi:hypothetical protein